MPKNLKRITGFGDLHFITFCCYRRRPFLDSLRARNLAVRALEQTRVRYGFALVGYVFMPEHVHLLLSESGSGSPATIIQSFKQRISPTLRARKRKRPGQVALRFPLPGGQFRRFWQRRYSTTARVGHPRFYNSLRVRHQPCVAAGRASIDEL